ncbi:hypothetical protein J6590_031078 [Homalodisca vitripennis]|nr:hypothetical protein J6590_031078 [Homalodisca vitripennis]
MEVKSVYKQKPDYEGFAVAEAEAAPLRPPTLKGKGGKKASGEPTHTAERIRRQCQLEELTKEATDAYRQGWRWDAWGQPQRIDSNKLQQVHF